MPKKDEKENRRDFSDSSLLFGASVMFFLIGISSYLYKEDINQKAVLFATVFLIGAVIISKNSFLLGMFTGSASIEVILIIVKKVPFEQVLRYSGYFALAALFWFIVALVRSRRKPREPDVSGKEERK